MVIKIREEFDNTARKLKTEEIFGNVVDENTKYLATLLNCNRNLATLQKTKKYLVAG